MDKMNFDQDFATVDMILASSLETRGVDAFVLSLIKAEKQMRRLFTFLVFQNPSYNCEHYSELRKTLAANRQIYFKGFIDGVNCILPRPLKKIYGDQYENDLKHLNKYAKDRNKIFHGQITEDGLDREDLLIRVRTIKKWCKNMADTLTIEIGYDGFSKSFVKSELELELKNLERFDTIEKYKAFIKKELQRK